MVYRFFKNTFLFAFILSVSCGRSTGQINSEDTVTVKEIDSVISAEKSTPKLVLGANKTEAYLPLLKNKNIGIVGNQSSLIMSNSDKLETPTYTHLVDSLVSLNLEVVKVFAPEHGFRGTADAGQRIKDGKDVKTGLPIISLYGDNKKPKPEQLKDIDIMIFDLQDVGARFYTYISSLHYVMEACAENNIPLIILDRPNPNGHYVDGPILNPEHSSFVGMHPVPVVHGLTLGEYAQMINGEKWLKNDAQCDLQIIKMENYTHDLKYELPVKPSPNLPNAKAINLYPSLCFFEGTNVNAGRGTNKQFQVYGSPYLNKEIYKYSYTPESLEGAKSPKHLGKLCYGEDLSETSCLNEINLEWLIDAYKNTSNKKEFFNSFFTKLAGGTELQNQIEAGVTSEEIKKSWQAGLKEFKAKRLQYLLYK
ncbi:uncharacterized protein YbbC (DUF1343 family) [Gillisia sp. Hel_I_86]|uniref:exo-beta-N-acetylmuramidase NamZ family protein n=1 Tax=Gillisia sp. Hel_I_86 TaxID=1249981 RepID=UPI001199AF3E|nr:DUF1343 domain-containing protein [Gillisia sp. Hel_I_86]TVZ25478.1 uncharacterized protein YbbC (DUF1343 family) [Gillisia sp. Hel_I_86]